MYPMGHPNYVLMGMARAAVLNGYRPGLRPLKESRGLWNAYNYYS